MSDYWQRKARWRELLQSAAIMRNEALSFGRSWSGFVPTLHLAMAFETEAKILALSFAN